MKPNDNDKKLFEALSKSSLGKDLADYLDRLSDFICDSRSWGKEDTRESANRAAQVIKEHIKAKIVRGKAKQIGLETFE